tara:strand:- start:285 stop:959 length:675 start_codon:yes stop_codon:yes gene_type:complete
MAYASLMNPSSILRASLVATFSLLFLVTANASTTYVGKVVSITDGDTLKVLVENEQLKIRLAEIDTPEKGQPFGDKSKQALANMVFGKQIKVTVVDVDHYGRLVGQVMTVDGNLDVNAALVVEGCAWVDRKYAKRPMLLELEENARRERRGLWADARPIPPWDWRRGERESKQKAETRAAFTCGTKRYCREMTSCEEAQFYLVQCGLTRLDGDKDGMPCEKKCR